MFYFGARGYFGYPLGTVNYILYETRKGPWSRRIQELKLMGARRIHESDRHSMCYAWNVMLFEFFKYIYIYIGIFIEFSNSTLCNFGKSII